MKRALLTVFFVIALVAVFSLKNFKTPNEFPPVASPDVTKALIPSSVVGFRDKSPSRFRSDEANPLKHQHQCQIPTLGQLDIEGLKMLKVGGKDVQRARALNPVQIALGTFPAGSILDFDAETGELLAIQFSGAIHFGRVNIKERLEISHGKNPGFRFKLAESYDNSGLLPSGTIVRAWVDDLKSSDLFFTALTPTTDFHYRGQVLKAGENYILDPQTGNVEDLSTED